MTIEYILMQPPFDMKPFEDMTKKEAQKHFEWFVEEIPQRIELLKSIIPITWWGNKRELDFSEESLIVLWNWYIDNVDIIEKTKMEIEIESSGMPEWVKRDICSYTISTGWMSITMDIAIYFAETIVKNYSSIHWGIISKPKSLTYVNKPVLIGFKAGLDLDTTNIVRNLALKVVAGEKEYEALLRLYKVWIEGI